jgi:hypothetical protein
MHDNTDTVIYFVYLVDDEYKFWIFCCVTLKQNVHNVAKHFICIYIGTKEERGLLAWGQSSEDSKDKPLSSDYEEGYEIYEIKSWTDKVKKLPFSKYIPFLPNYDSSSINCRCACQKKNKSDP